MQRPKVFCGLALLLLVCSLIPAYAGIAYEGWLGRGDVALKQALLDLTSDMTIMCLAAHPDDEDGATLTYYRKKHGVRTVVVLATRGEGGQNQIGPELYEELGVIRAHETQAAARIYGAEVYNLNKRDFGYSKSAEETFNFWGHEDSLRRLVRIIRTVKPDVIITNHDTEHGHGHHRAFGMMALEVFDAAADPRRFPEQLENGLSPWQVKRLFLRCGKDDADVGINVGEYDQPRGYSYAQIANEGLKMHKSQGMGGSVKRGNLYRYYKLIKSSAPAPEKLESLLDGLEGHASLAVSKGNSFTSFEGMAVDAVSMPHHKVAKAVIEHLRTVRGGEMKVRNPGQSEEKLEVAAARALDLYLMVEVDDKIVTRSQEFTTRVSLTNCGHHFIQNVKLGLRAPQLGDVVEREDLVFEQLGYNETATETFVVRVSDDASVTLPHADHLYDDLFMKPLIEGIARYEMYDTPLSISSKATVDVAPYTELHILPETSMLPVSRKGRSTRYVVNIVNRMPGEIHKGHVEFSSPSGWKAVGMNQDFALTEDQQAFAAFDLTVPADVTSGDFSLKAKASYTLPSGMLGQEETAATVKILDVKVAEDLYVGYVKSYDNTLERALKQLNVRNRSLYPDDLRFGNLSLYDTIILDIRAYLAREDLIDSNQRVLDYVKDGGNLVVMYHKTYEWNSRGYAPYKLELSHDRVTVEEAPITILAPEHPLFTFPNSITESDWDGWIQERGLYFPSEWAPEYKELLSCSDPGEKALRGGYLVARYGKGTYIYTSYVWYRQLQNMNPGAFRNFANMVSLPKYAQSLRR